MSDDFLHALTAVLAGAVFIGDAIPARFRADWSGLAPVTPLALVRPLDTAGVARALSLCNLHRIPVVAQGGLTGLAGGAHPIAGGVALSLDRMNGIEEIDPVMAKMTVKAGTPLATVQAAAIEAGLFFGLDLGARDSCSIGGNIATNAGGNRVIRYGMTRESVLGIEAVLADGTVVSSINKMLKNNAGYDLKLLFIGSEGTLGVITRAVLRLQARPRRHRQRVLRLSGFRGGAEPSATGAPTARRASLTSFEVMWPSFYDLVTGKLPQLRRPFAKAPWLRSDRSGGRTS